MNTKNVNNYKFVWNWTSNVKGMEDFWTQMDKEGGGLEN